MPDLLPGSTVLGLDTPPTVTDVQPTSFTTTSTAYTAIGADDCAVVFTAPTTGRVKIYTNARCNNDNSAADTSGTLVAPETRLGGTVGAGTVVEAVADANGCSHYGETFARSGVMHVLEGLIPGEEYNTQLLHKVSVSPAVGSIALRALTVEPAT